MNEDRFHMDASGENSKEYRLWYYIPRFLRFRKFMLCVRVFWGRSESN